jgi:hypothetical protein
MIMIVKLDKLTEGHLRALDKFVRGPSNKVTLLGWEANSSGGGCWREFVLNHEPLVEIMEGSCRLNPDTGYYRVDLLVHETTKNPETTDREERPVLMTNFQKLLDQLNLFPRTPPSGGRIIPSDEVTEKHICWGKPLPEFARPRRVATRSETSKPITSPDEEAPTSTADARS